MDQVMTPIKRVCSHPLSTSSASSCSSPDINFDSVQLSFDDDSGSDQSFTSTSTAAISPLTVSNPASFFYDSKHSQTFSFLKPRYVAPPSPLAAGVHSASINNEQRKNTFVGSNYTFTPVNDQSKASVMIIEQSRRIQPARWVYGSHGSQLVVQCKQGIGTRLKYSQSRRRLTVLKMLVFP